MCLDDILVTYIDDWLFMVYLPKWMVDFAVDQLSNGESQRNYVFSRLVFQKLVNITYIDSNDTWFGMIVSNVCSWWLLPKTCYSERVWSMWNICEHVGSSLSCSTRISELAKQPQRIQIGLPDVIFKWPMILGEGSLEVYLILMDWDAPPPRMPGLRNLGSKGSFKLGSPHTAVIPVAGKKSDRKSAKKEAVFFPQFPGCMERLAYTWQQTSVPIGSHVWYF